MKNLAQLGCTAPKKLCQNLSLLYIFKTIAQYSKRKQKETGVKHLQN